MIAAGVDTNAIGFAPQAQLVASYYANDLTEMAQMATNGKVRESNHSYSIQAGWYGNWNGKYGELPLWIGDASISTTQSWLFGFYEGSAQTMTKLSIQLNVTSPCFAQAIQTVRQTVWLSTGRPLNRLRIMKSPTTSSTSTTCTAYLYNELNSRPTNDAYGGYNTLTTYAVSKNTLVVGAVNPNTNGYSGTNTTGIAYFSAMGPTADGRIKPDVVADGVNEYSCSSTSATSYQTLWDGTSFAAPAVTGSLGLITELLQRTLRNQQPAAGFNPSRNHDPHRRPAWHQCRSELHVWLGVD